MGEMAYRLSDGKDRVAGECLVIYATALEFGAMDTFFARRLHRHGQKPAPW